VNALIRLLCSTLFIFATASCALHEQRTEYVIASRYQHVEPKLDEFYASQETSFSLFQDKVTAVKSDEVRQNQAHFSLFRWAPDIGTQKLHESRLTKISSDQCRLELVTPPIHRWGTSHEARSENIDKWLTSNFIIRSKVTREFVPESGIKSDLWYRTNRILE
jgi:hypothetical protein